MIWDSLDKFQKMKRERIAYLVFELYRRDGEAELREFKGSIAVNYGIRRETVDEYLGDLLSYGMIEIANNKILLKWDKEKIEAWLKKQGMLPREERNE